MTVLDLSVLKCTEYFLLAKVTAIYNMHLICSYLQR